MNVTEVKEDQQNPVQQLLTLLKDDVPTIDVLKQLQDCKEYFSKSIEPLSAQEIRRYLITTAFSSSSSSSSSFSSSSSSFSSSFCSSSPSSSSSSASSSSCALNSASTSASLSSSTSSSSASASSITLEDDLLWLVLQKMHPQSQSSDSLFVRWQFGWQLLHKALDDKKQHQASPDRDRRLYCKLLLHYEHLLIAPAITVINGACFWCTQFFKTRHDYRHKNVCGTLADLITAAFDMLELFTWLLMETRKDECIRPMARMLLPLFNFFHSVFQLKEERRANKHGCSCEQGHDARNLDTYLCRLSLLTPIVIERIAAAVPAECVDDRTAHAFLPCGFIRTTTVSGRRVNSAHVWTEDDLHQYLSVQLGKHITFNAEYVESVMRSEESYQAVPRAAIMLLCKLPDQQLRRVIGRIDKQHALALRRCAAHYDWYHIPKPQRVCFAEGCGKHGDAFPMCAACGVAEYCSVECQRNDWVKHKPMCLRWRQKT